MAKEEEPQKIRVIDVPTATAPAIEADGKVYSAEEAIAEMWNEIREIKKGVL